MDGAKLPSEVTIAVLEAIWQEVSRSIVPANYRPRRRPPRGGQTWRTFVRNHARELWACDFLSQHTATFTVAYVFVIMEIASRRIVHVNVTTTSALPWVQQQVPDATPAGTARRGGQRNSLRRRGGGLVGAKGESPLVTHFILAVTVPYVMDEVQAFAEEVIPAVRSA